MAEYIAREVLLAQLRAMESYNVSPMYRRGYDDCVVTILNAPAADVVPGVHGRWTTKHYIDGIFEGTNFDECSACGYQRVFEDPALKTRYDYCPRCGAKMDGGTE